eukprot:TRINITY_DN9959_c0_g1_i3.p2 TRINITY_DN9959_c0_g1~~TRINITY_DN9959_c0_g1_i3.p2  ORF type:complete len:103 (+),score=32.69 TRINITY_DN9959_c0_g1_i3:99-407(+)
MCIRDRCVQAEPSHSQMEAVLCASLGQRSGKMLQPADQTWLPAQAQQLRSTMAGSGWQQIHWVNCMLQYDIVLADLYNVCLLYTSDAADEEDSVDLGGRRIF